METKIDALSRPLLSTADVDEAADAIRADDTVTTEELTQLTDEFLRADAEGRVRFEVREHFSRLLTSLSKETSPGSDALAVRTNPAALEAQIEKLDERIADVRSKIATEEARASSLRVQIKSRMLEIQRNIALAEAARKNTRNRNKRNGFLRDFGSLALGFGVGVLTANPFLAVGAVIGSREIVKRASGSPSTARPDAELARLEKLQAEHSARLADLRRQQSAIVTVRRAVAADAPPPVDPNASSIERVRLLRSHVDHRRTLLRSLEDELAVLRKMNARSGRFDAVLATLEAHYETELKAAKAAERAAYEETVALVVQLGLHLTSNATTFGLLARAEGAALSLAIKGIAGARLDLEGTIDSLADELVRRGMAAATERDDLHQFFMSMLRGAGSSDREDARRLIADAGLSAAQRALLDRIFDAPEDVPIRPLVAAVLKRPEILDVRRRFVSALLAIGDTDGAVAAMEREAIRPVDAILALAERLQTIPEDDTDMHNVAMRSLAGFAKGTPAEAIVEAQIARDARPAELQAALRTALDR